MSDPFSDTQACALRLLSRREHSRLELCNKLSLRNFPAAVINGVLDTLITQGWQSDRRFAEMYVRSRIERGDGIVKIQMKLGEFGISDDIISQTLPQDDQFWQQHLARKWGKKYLAATDSLATRAKQVRFLQARGFTWDQIKAAQKTII